MAWTQFWDMHSGGGTKLYVDGVGKEKIYIEAPRAEAEVIFYNRFGHAPDRVTCTCCGSDYSIDEGELDQLTGYHRNCKYVNDVGYVEERDTRHDGIYERHGEPVPAYKTVDEYVLQPDVLVINAADIQPHEREGEVPRQGYVWM